MKKRNLIYMLAAAALVGCAKEPGGGSQIQEKVWFVPRPTVAAEASVATRSVIDGSQYFPLLRYGLWIEALDAAGDPDAATTAWYQDVAGYANILASRSAYSGTGSTWSFTPKGAPALTSRVGLFPGKSPKVTICGVYPYYAAFTPTDATAVPFKVGLTDASNYDYMYTGPVVVDIENDAVSGLISKPLPFHHVMTLVEFRLSTTLIGSLQINSITLEAVDNTDQPKEIFLTEGTFSALDGSINPGPTSVTTDKLTVTYNKKVAYASGGGLGHTSFGVIVPPIDITAATGTKLKVSFEFDYKNLDEDEDDMPEGLGGYLELDLDAIQTDTGDGNGATPKGLVTGYRYTYPIAVDNFIKYTGYPEVQPWAFAQDGNGDDLIYDIIL